jgi:hypothetical protein
MRRAVTSEGRACSQSQHGAVCSTAAFKALSQVLSSTYTVYITFLFFLPDYCSNGTGFEVGSR